LPVTFGASTTVTGAGEWTYPDTGLVIGLKLDVTTIPLASRTWGTEVIRYRDLGVWAPVTEAGKMHAQPVWNDQEITYDVGKGPVGLAYDLASGVSITATEILSETPPSGGGGSGPVTAYVIYDSNTAVSVPTAAWTLTVPNLLVAHTDDTVLSPDGSGGVTIHVAGLYLISGLLYWSIATMPPNLMAAVYTNGSLSFPDQGTLDPVASAAYVPLNAMWTFAIGDVVNLRGYQDVGTAQNVFPQYSIAKLT
jgi:hypothetical protein